MAVIGTPRKFHMKYKFIVELDQISYSGFQKCSELSSELAKVEHYEGGAMIPDKQPGRATYADITLEQGATNDLSFFVWYKQTANIAANAGAVPNLHKRNLSVVQQERDNSTLIRWNLFNAWISKFVAGDWDNTSDDIVMRMITLTFDYFDTPTTLAA